MNRLSVHAWEVASNAKNKRDVEKGRRSELREAFIAAIKERTLSASSSGALMAAVAKARVAAGAELWMAVEHTMMLVSV